MNEMDENQYLNECVDEAIPCNKIKDVNFQNCVILSLSFQNKKLHLSFEAQSCGNQSRGEGFKLSFCHPRNSQWEDDD